MASMGWAGACPSGTRDQGQALSQRGIFRKDAPSNHDAGSGPRPTHGDHDHACLLAQPSILLRHRPPCQVHAPVPAVTNRFFGFSAGSACGARRPRSALPGRHPWGSCCLLLSRSPHLVDPRSTRPAAPARNCPGRCAGGRPPRHHSSPTTTRNNARSPAGAGRCSSDCRTTAEPCAPSSPPAGAAGCPVPTAE